MNCKMKIEFEFSVGEQVHDDLTQKDVTVIGLMFFDGKKNVKDNRTALKTIGYWIDDDSHLQGARHPWELRKKKEDDEL